MWLSNPFCRLWLDAGSLSLEAATVIGSRILKLAAGGGAAETEINLMVNEKIKAALSLYRQAWTGKLGASPLSAAQIVITHYMTEVRANRLRLQPHC
jgi:hypothetical protein